MRRIEVDILKVHTLTLILSLVEEQPSYGFQLAKEIGRRSEGTIPPRFQGGTILSVLLPMRAGYGTASRDGVTGGQRSWEETVAFRRRECDLGRGLLAG